LIPKIRKGSIITAKYLNEGFGEVNRLVKEAVSPPRQVNPPAPADVQNADPSAESLGTFQEQSRETSTVQVFDQGGTNYAEIERIDAVSFKNGRGEVIKLVFVNE